VWELQAPHQPLEPMSGPVGMPRKISWGPSSRGEEPARVASLREELKKESIAHEQASLPPVLGRLDLGGASHPLADGPHDVDSAVVESEALPSERARLAPACPQRGRDVEEEAPQGVLLFGGDDDLPHLGRGWDELLRRQRFA